MLEKFLNIFRNWSKHKIVVVVTVISVTFSEAAAMGADYLSNGTISASTVLKAFFIPLIAAWVMASVGAELLVRLREAEAELQVERTSLAQRVEARTAELRAANTELARAVRAKDEFLATMSHELRTPLTAILAFSDMLFEEVYGPLNERQCRAVVDIRDSGHHLLDLINDVLDVAKMEAGTLTLDIGLVDVNLVCWASLRLVEQVAKRKHLRISTSFDRAVKAIRGDERRVKQMLVNLLSNAVKFTPEGGDIGLEVRGDYEAHSVHFTVWDTGIGIAEEDVKCLFQPFVQLDTSLSREHGGTGLGLALVHRMTELHGGGVTVESEPGQGSRFTISLPWEENTADIGVEREIALKTSSEAPETGLTGHDDLTDRDLSSTMDVEADIPLILLAEDNPVGRQALVDFLQEQGYRVAVAQDGATALHIARHQPPDLILMDIQMPGVDGLEATRRVRADASLHDIPIIALTALAMPGDRERCLEVGANAYVSKPIGLNRLLTTIESQLSPLKGDLL
jgi:signal transduction histidine kinase/CheY-like chemotaxis protein